MRRFSMMLVLLIFSTILIVCGKSEKEKQMAETAKETKNTSEKIAQGGAENMADAVRQMGEAMSGSESVEPVDFRKLKELLPEKLGNMTRTNAQGEKTSAMGIKVSQAEGSYSNEEGSGSIQIKITDMGTMSGFAAMATMAWAFAEFDRESDSGYEKTTTYQGNKAYEKYDNESKNGEISVLVAKRFVVELNGYDISMDVLKQALEKIDLGKLRKLE